METKSPIINILTYKLKYELANQIHNEFQSRFKEANYLIDNYKTYGVLKKNIKTVELLLALSIFHKRVIANLDAVVKFYGTVSRISEAETIKMGNYSLTYLEKNKLLGITMNYDILIQKFSVPSSIMDYTETKDFLIKLISLKSALNYANKEKPRGSQEKKDKGTTEEGNDTKIPF